MGKDIKDFSELKLRQSLRDSTQTNQTKNEESEKIRNRAKRKRKKIRTETGAVDRVAPFATTPINRVEKPNRFGRYPNISEPDRETDRERTNP